jgi:hypothetical protein
VPAGGVFVIALLWSVAFVDGGGGGGGGGGLAFQLRRLFICLTEQFFVMKGRIGNKEPTCLMALIDILASRCGSCYCYLDRRPYAQHS